MSPFNSLLPLLLAASTITTGVFALPQAGPSATPPPAAASQNDPAEAVAIAEAATAAAVASDAAAYSAAAASDSAYYATAAATETYFAPPQQTGPDQCGPKVPDPAVLDTCDSFVEKVNAPHPYGVQCLKDVTGGNLNETSCQQLIPIMCTNQFQHAGEWVWATQGGCSLGSYLPPGPDAAKWPEQINCEELIYGAMLQACTDGSAPYNYASVNLVNLPTNQQGGTGSQVNPGYPSYLITRNQPRLLGDIPGSPSAVQIDVPKIMAQNLAAESAAYNSESALLAGMVATETGPMKTQAAAALSEIVAYQTMSPNVEQGN